MSYTKFLRIKVIIAVFISVDGVLLINCTMNGKTYIV